MAVPSSLVCPICQRPLAKSDSSLKCELGHSYDFAKSGYINLLNPGKKNNAKTGESKEMIQARTSFFASGHYQKIKEYLIELIKDYKKDLIIDAGCGEGYYTEGVAEKYPESTVIGFDMSKHGAEHGSKSSRAKGIANTFYAVSNIFNMPLYDECADVIINLFAPVPYEEFARVLKKGGYLIIGASGAKHLIGLKGILYENVYLNELNVHKNAAFEHICIKNLTYDIEIFGNDTIMKLFTMTPYYHHTSDADKNKLSAISKLNTTIEVDFTILRKI
ncbi:MAG: methyltransferase domain-containing protein [Clostridia bacterium]|nr:methyltransferase domain-containing protein [Clostridia bacterium]